MLALAAAGAFMAAPPPVQAQAQPAVRRCIAADGTQVFTDRRCADIGASESIRRPPPASGATLGPGGLRRAARPACARTVEELVHELTFAFDTRDVNRLAGVYHWPGASAESANRMMDRLGRLVERPLDRKSVV